MDKIRTLISGLCLFLVLSLPAAASTQAAITSYFPNADTIYLVRVIDLKQNVATFDVTDVVRGRAIKKLTLTVEFPDAFKTGSKWVLLSCEPWRKSGSRGNVVGAFLFGDCGWIFDGVAEDDSKNSSNALTAENIKRIASQNPQKP